ncbi:TIGR04282 family arsenosugar biosynthesis glycosyltransferase [Rudaeicoccus suwonensis]|uniref:TIGR04282 family arsenosugar biosynthesis glycosyltransferase n=1 Tax=Rudaeicoccus suwonensis TaxID=657409 RepID=UPI001BA7607F|nr:DUF2064 domain-containing protein [Rudaeicoccus suwonensis]
MNPDLLIVAKAPVPGVVKTRLAADLGGDVNAAAQLAAAGLLDTLEVCSAWSAAGHRRLSLAGSLESAVRADELQRAVQGWVITPQVTAMFAQRLAAAHMACDGPVIQLGMDTPQVTTALLTVLAQALTTHDAVVAPAADGGWWALGLRSGLHGALIADVPMSTENTCTATVSALERGGLSVATAPILRDVDHLDDAIAVGRECPDTHFARSLEAQVLTGAGVLR